jgi:hypothetical protein
MKRALVFSVLGLLLVASLSAGVVKQTRSEVTFKGFGTLSLESSEKLVPQDKFLDTQNEFKGKGIAGSIAAKTLLRSGRHGQIFDLANLTLTTIDFKKKQYQVEPIKPLELKEAKGQPAKEEKPSEVKITRNEFKVEDTGETKDINGFPCTRYLVSWIVDWENTQTGEKGTDKLLTDVWTTPETSDLKTAREEEMKFSQAYLQAVGLSGTALERDVLGTSWMSMLSALSPTSQRPEADMSQFASEMKKIKGYPIVTDGKLYATSEGGPKQEQPEEESGGGGLFGKLAKKVIKKKPEEPSNEPALAFYTEVKSVSVESLGPQDFQVPADFKKKG